MQLLSDQTLLLLDPKQRGENQPLELKNLRNLPAKLEAGLLKVVVLATKTPEGQTQLQFPSGQVFSADVPDSIKPGSQLLLKLDGQNPPQVLRILLPATATSAAQIKPATNPPILLDIAEGTIAKEGMTLKFTTPAPNAAPNSTLTAPRTSAFLPTAGLSVMGQVATPPQQGGQTLNLTTGHQLQTLVPPVLDVAAEVVLKIGENQTAKIEKLTLPHTTQITTQIAGSSKGPVNSVGQAIDLLLKGIGPNDDVLAKLPIKDLPTGLKLNTNPQAATVQAITPQGTGTNSITIGLQNGVSLTIDITEELLAKLGLKAPQTSNVNSPASQTATTTAQGNPPLMAIRFTDAGVLEVLRTQPARAVEGRNPENPAQQDPARQFPPSAQGGKEAKIQNPQLSAGQIATGKVVEQRPGGEVILQFGNNIRTPVIAQRLLPVGSQISVHVMPDGHAEILDMVLPKGTNRHNALLRFSLQWDSLKQAISTLEEQNPEGAEKLKRALPEANEKLLPKLLQLSQSITQQNMRSFFGDDVLNILRALGFDGMLQADAAQLNNILQKPDTPDGWRALLFPYIEEHSQDLKQGSFFWRKHKKEKADDDDSLRFVLNVQMSALGQVQLDGLMKGSEAMYLKLRLTEPLETEEERGLKDLVQNSLQVAGLSGTLQVERVSFFETDPLHEMLAPIDEEIPEHQLNVEA